MLSELSAGLEYTDINKAVTKIIDMAKKEFILLKKRDAITIEAYNRSNLSYNFRCNMFI